MANTNNVAREVLWPTNASILIRLAFLYVGQGESTVVIAAHGNGLYKASLVDINSDRKNRGIDVVRLMKDLVQGEQVETFINTHPHCDHLAGVEALHEEVGIRNVWHSGHRPGRAHDEAYQELQRVIRKVKANGGDVTELNGSNMDQAFGEARCHVLAPAEHVSDEIDGEDPETRYARIHEQCAIMKFGTASTWILLTGDADRNAFEKHITDYHRDHLPSVVLSASHHCSRSFFKRDEEDEPYLDALEAIDPKYVVVSAPTQEESKYDHPHDDAWKLYEERVTKDAMCHTGERRCTFICDIYRDGTYGGVQDDAGRLARNYGLKSDDDSGNGAGKAGWVPAYPSTKVDDRPMGSQQVEPA